MNLIMYRSLLSCLLAATCVTAGAQESIAADTLLSQIHSVEQADAMLNDAAAERAKTEADFAAQQRECYNRFFVNNCLDHAREQRRAALAQLRPIEGAAKHFKRADAVDQRELAMTEREQKTEAAAAERASLPVKPVPAPAPPSAKGKSVAQRQAEHDAKVTRQAAQDAASAAQRDANRAQFEQKQRDAAQRQSEIAAKQAAKQAQRVKEAADQSK